MSNFVSDKGIWHPAKERVALVNRGTKPIENMTKKGMETVQPGEDFIYEGPNRMAVKMIHENGGEYLGHDFRNDPDFRQSIRNQGFETIEDYLKNLGYDEVADKKKFEERAAVLKKSEIAKKAEEIRIMGGGKDYSGNKDNDVIGGFGDERLRSPKELDAKKEK